MVKRSWLGPVAAAVIMVVVVAALFLNSRNQAAPWDGAAEPTARPSAADVYDTFQPMRNECGACGTDTPVGAWEAEDGRLLVFGPGDNFTAFFTDGTKAEGTWELTGLEMCLRPESGGIRCMFYQQKVDAMMLEDAIYIRQ